MSTKRTLNIGLVGCGFMGRTHSNAFARVNQFFESGCAARSQGGLRTQSGDRRGVRAKLGFRKLRDGLA